MNLILTAEHKQLGKTSGIENVAPQFLRHFHGGGKFIPLGGHKQPHLVATSEIPRQSFCLFVNYSLKMYRINWKNPGASRCKKGSCYLVRKSDHSYRINFCRKPLLPCIIDRALSGVRWQVPFYRINDLTSQRLNPRLTDPTSIDIQLNFDWRRSPSLVLKRHGLSDSIDEILVCLKRLFPRTRFGKETGVLNANSPRVICEQESGAGSFPFSISQFKPIKPIKALTCFASIISLDTWPTRQP